MGPGFSSTAASETGVYGDASVSKQRNRPGGPYLVTRAQVAGQGKAQDVRLFEHPDFEQVILQAAEQFQLRPAIIEKDYYVKVRCEIVNLIRISL
jgi:hypothetical protein